METARTEGREGQRGQSQETRGKYQQKEGWKEKAQAEKSGETWTGHSRLLESIAS